MKLKILLSACFFAGIICGNAQKSTQQQKTPQSSTHSGAENIEKTIPFPTTLKALTEIYGNSYEELTDSSTGKNYYQWTLEKGTVLAFVPLTDTDQYIGVVASSEGEETVSGLPFDLVFNQTTFDESRYKLAAYKPTWVQVAGDEENSTYFVLSFKKNKSYNYLYFYENSKKENVLKAYTISTIEMQD